MDIKSFKDKPALIILIIILSLIFCAISASAIGGIFSEPTNEQSETKERNEETNCSCNKLCNTLKSCTEAIDCLKDSCQVDSLDPDQDGIPCETTLCTEDEENVKGEETETYKVTRVIDGDTIEVVMDGKKEKVRLVGVNAPEIDKDECFWKQSKEKLEELVLNYMVILEVDETQGDKDKYDRFLRFVILQDGTNVIETMIKGGFAKEYTYSKDYKYQKLFKEAQQFAKDSNNGLWGDACKCDKKAEVKRVCVDCKKADVTLYSDWDCSTITNRVDDANCTDKCYTPPAETQTTTTTTPTPVPTPPPTPQYICDCSKACGSMASCEEAYYQLNTCGCSRRDGDGDGVPCESLCG